MPVPWVALFSLAFCDSVPALSEWVPGAVSNLAAILDTSGAAVVLVKLGLELLKPCYQTNRTTSSK